jgi:hypothetical protein
MQLSVVTKNDNWSREPSNEADANDAFSMLAFSERCIEARITGL